MKGKLKTLAIWSIIAVIFIVLLTSIVDNSNSKMTYSELLYKMSQDEVKEIELNSNGKEAYVKLEGDSVQKQVNILIILLKMIKLYYMESQNQFLLIF